jgi:hypothetical protein
MPNDRPPIATDVPKGAPFSIAPDGPHLECKYRKRPKGLAFPALTAGVFVLLSAGVTVQFVSRPTLAGGLAVCLALGGGIVIAILWLSVSIRDERLVLDGSGLLLEIKTPISRGVELRIPLSDMRRFAFTEWKQVRNKTTYWVQIQSLRGQLTFAYDVAQTDGEWLAARLDEHLDHLLGSARGEINHGLH